MSADPRQLPIDGKGHAKLLKQAAAAVSRIYQEHFGRAPNFAIAAFSTSDTLVVTARGVLTDTERNYKTRADHLRLRECRTFFQYANPAAFCDPIERITGRRVRALVSGVDVREDIATETFILEARARRGRPGYSSERRSGIYDRRAVDAPESSP